MDYNMLLDMVAELGYRLAMCGAETYRIEESINRILDSYGIASEAFSIPNCLIVSIETAEGKPMTRMRRIDHHGNDLDGVERYSNLSRRICSEKPEPREAMTWICETASRVKKYPMAVYLLGCFLGGFGFAIFFNGSLLDSVLSGVCGVLAGFVSRFTDSLKVNPFFSTIAAAFPMALLAYFLDYIGLTTNTAAVVIGALMVLVPGLLFTNAMRDIIYGDTNSGINRIVQVFLIALAIALGTGVAWNLASALWGNWGNVISVEHPLWIECIFCLIGCVGFSIIFNIHGPGGLLCAIGGALTWLVFSIILHFSANDIMAYFWATMTASLYAEIMARVRKYPAISYLVVSIFPLLPGAGIYYTMNFAVGGDMGSFAQQGTHTIAIAGIMAVGILLVSTVMRVWTLWRQRKTP